MVQVQTVRLQTSLLLLVETLQIVDRCTRPAGTTTTDFKQHTFLTDTDFLRPLRMQFKTYFKSQEKGKGIKNYLYEMI